MRRSSVAACVIARDEEHFIAGCLASVQAFVDEMVVLDTGSVDRTRDIARLLGARVEDFAWRDDFAAARNAAIEVAAADWIFMLDADERLEPESGPVVRRLPPHMPADVHAACPVIESRTLDSAGPPSVTDQVARFFRRSADVRYVGTIHEDLVFLPNPSATRCVSVQALRITHYGYDSCVYADRQKDERNTRLLQQQLAKSPNDPRTLYFLAQQHSAMGRYAEAVHYARRFLARASSVREAFVVEAYAILLKALIELDRPAEIQQTAEVAAAANLLGAAAYQALAGFERRHGDSRTAREHLRRAHKDRLPTGLTRDHRLPRMS